LRAALVLLLAAALAAPQAEAGYSEARAWFQNRSIDDRFELQRQLFWTGDYPGPIDGLFGQLTYAALEGFQRRAGGPAGGVLTPQQRWELTSEYRLMRDWFDFLWTRRPIPPLAAAWPAEAPPQPRSDYTRGYILILP
jgi:hypothetical protein